MAERRLVDGVWRATVPADDRGLMYGDGVFRTLRVCAGSPVAWETHMARLMHDCNRLDLRAPNRDTLAAEAETLCAHGGDGVLKIVITRGSGGRGYTPPNGNSRRIVSVHPLPAHADRTTAIALECSPLRLAAQVALAGVKHLNRLEQVLARAACARRAQEDALMCDGNDRIIATTMRNLLFQNTNDDWITPALSRAGVAGATRQRLMTALAGQAKPVVARDIARAELADMTAAVACNSIGGAVAVSAIDGHVLPQSHTAAERCRDLLVSV